MLTPRHMCFGECIITFFSFVFKIYYLNPALRIVATSSIPGDVMATNQGLED